MEKEILKIFLEVREKFGEIKEKVSLLKTYLELHVSSPGIAISLNEFEKIFGFRPKLIYRSKENIYGISVIYTIDDDITRGIIAHEFAEIVAKEKGIYNHETVDKICFEKGFGKELLLALENILPGRVERIFIDAEDLKNRIKRLKEKLK
ncbi:MAG TPA: hypothetical protein ENG63_05420 [Candidatus Desulfofervidus auxilii]|uniref:Uncharacterized protein n=1 Tax=Desulfofervidus auxilii TaxID=1621989 RepID=A0A7C0U2S9_DESA2|nr:hypothetical protein [Candidatus Desulfofervidus auxilii]